MFVICSTAGVRAKYGSSSEKVLKGIARLGAITDVSGMPPEKIQERIAKLAKGPACLVGGYDLIPPFMRPNPTFNESHDDDKDIPTDAPYGATPGKAVEEYAPSRAVSRIPDDATVDAAGFMALLAHQVAAPTTATPAGSFEEAAAEFSGALNFVHGKIPGTTAKQRLSPPEKLSAPGLTASISGKGRFHILLHGANFDPDWGSLWGHTTKANAPFVRALSAQLLDLCDLRGSIVSFSSCYSAMLDVAPAVEGARTSKNQVALACLSHGAKVVFGATRSNWIETSGNFDGFGPGLMAEVWTQLSKGKPAAEALRIAKSRYLKVALSQHTSEHKYALKTVLQAQCYGHPAATL
jgi:hypothetical protein